MKKILATFISGTLCSKGVALKSYQNRTLPQEAIVIDLGLDLAANESRNPAKQKQAQPADLQRSASWPTRTN